MKIAQTVDGIQGSMEALAEGASNFCPLCTHVLLFARRHVKVVAAPAARVPRCSCGLHFPCSGRATASELAAALDDVRDWCVRVCGSAAMEAGKASAKTRPVSPSRAKRRVSWSVTAEGVARVFV
jgi:hypothetical protein